MQKTAPEPTQILPAPPADILIAWTTGEKFTLSYAELRYQCPCAACVDENTGRRVITRERVPVDIKIVGAQVVGRYALQISFSDRHATGMFHFDRLYTLCREVGKAIS